MTKAEIIAELRRSATEDFYPSADIRFTAFDKVCKWKDKPYTQSIIALPEDDCRTFFLLVAEALICAVDA